MTGLLRGFLRENNVNACKDGMAYEGSQKIKVRRLFTSLMIKFYLMIADMVIDHWKTLHPNIFVKSKQEYLDYF